MARAKGSRLKHRLLAEARRFGNDKDVADVEAFDKKHLARLVDVGFGGVSARKNTRTEKISGVGSDTRVQLTRWNGSRPYALDNLVCLTLKQTISHRAVMCSTRERECG